VGAPGEYILSVRNADVAARQLAANAAATDAALAAAVLAAEPSAFAAETVTLSKSSWKLTEARPAMVPRDWLIANAAIGSWLPGKTLLEPPSLVCDPPTSPGQSVVWNELALAWSLATTEGTEGTV
jgi:hypothetical protein